MRKYKIKGIEYQVDELRQIPKGNGTFDVHRIDGNLFLDNVTIPLLEVTQEIGIRNDNFSELTLDGKGYATAIYTNILLAAENPWILMRNPTNSGKVIRLFEQLIAIPDSPSTLRSVIRIYKNPTVTLNGIAANVGGLRNNQTPSVLLITTAPTVTNNGILVQVYGATNSPVQRELNLTRYIEEGDSLLITATPSGATTNHSFTQAWAEVD